MLRILHPPSPSILIAFNLAKEVEHIICALTVSRLSKWGARGFDHGLLA